MAEVYEVEDVGLGSRYALKLFTYARSEEASARARFFAEGRLLAKLDHPRLVRVYDIGEDATTGHPYFVMDLVLGPDGKPTTLADADVAGADEEQVATWYEDLARTRSRLRPGTRTCARGWPTSTPAAFCTAT